GWPHRVRKAASLSPRCTLRGVPDAARESWSAADNVSTAQPAEARRLDPIRTNIPARLDRLPWSRFHWLVVFALGASWAIDGLEVTLTGAVSGILQDAATLHLSSGAIGALGSFYLFGAVIGALVCGHLTDRHGRSKLFFATLAVYLAGTLATAFSGDFWSMSAGRWITGFKNPKNPTRTPVPRGQK